MESQNVTIPNCTEIRATEKALLIRLGDGREHWIPRSQIIADNGDGSIVVSKWYADNKQLFTTGNPGAPNDRPAPSRAHDYMNSGTVAANQRKRPGKRDPDIAGMLDNVTCAHCGHASSFWLSGWLKETAKGKFYSLSVKPREAASTERPSADGHRSTATGSRSEAPTDGQSN